MKLLNISALPVMKTFIVKHFKYTISQENDKLNKFDMSMLLLRSLAQYGSLSFAHLAKSSEFMSRVWVVGAQNSRRIAAVIINIVSPSILLTIVFSQIVVIGIIANNVVHAIKCCVIIVVQD